MSFELVQLLQPLDVHLRIFLLQQALVQVRVALQQVDDLVPVAVLRLSLHVPQLLAVQPQKLRDSRAGVAELVILAPLLVHPERNDVFEGSVEEFHAELIVNQPAGSFASFARLQLVISAVPLPDDILDIFHRDPHFVQPLGARKQHVCFLRLVLHGQQHVLLLDEQKPKLVQVLVGLDSKLRHQPLPAVFDFILAPILLNVEELHQDLLNILSFCGAGVSRNYQVVSVLMEIKF